MAGALVERGADATPLVGPLVAFLHRVTGPAAEFYEACAAQVPADAEDEDEAFQQAVGRLGPVMPKAAEAWHALELLNAPVIAILAASPGGRTQCRPLVLQLQELREHNNGASWLVPMLEVLDREPILVIEPDTALGLIGRMSGVSSNFQLHVLLMDIFPTPRSQSAPRVSRHVADIVHGRAGKQEDDAPLTGAWNMHAWTALQGTGVLPHDHQESSIKHWIWNEGLPADIPTFDGYRVVALGPPSYARQFLAQRDFLGLRADIEIERLLSADDVKAWIARFSTATPDGSAGAC
jgi:hypothetical protein